MKLRLMLLVLLSLSTQNVYAASSFTTSFEGTGNYDLAIDGKGLYQNPTTLVRGENQSSGTIDLNIPGSVVYGEVYWHGYGDQYWNNYAETGNPNVTFNGNALVGNSLAEAPGGDFGIGYWNDVTNYLQPGTNNYTISGVSFSGGPQNLGVNNGFGVTAVYEDPSALMSYISIKHGEDYAWHGFSGNNGPATQVLDFNVPVADQDRMAEFTLVFGGGSGTTEFADRRSYIWTATSLDAAIPGTLIDQPFATKNPDPYAIKGANGYDWDVYTMNVLIPANTSKLFVQVESDHEVYNGESFAHLEAALKVPQNNTVVPEPATMTLMGMGLLGGFRAMARRKKS